MNETEVKPKLSKHISAAVNAIQKEIDRKEKEITKLNKRANHALDEAADLRNAIVGLAEQIAKLQGE